MSLHSASPLSPAQPSWLERLPRFGLWLAVWWLALLWLRPFASPDEGRYVGIARDMLASGQWVVPELNGLPFFHKPILYYWVEAAGMGLFGVNTFGGRMAPLLGALMMVLAAGWHVRRRVGPAASRWAMALLSLQPLTFVGGQYANLDMLVAGCITLTIVLWSESALSESPRERFGLMLGGWAAAGLGILAKGLIGLVLPMAVVGLWLLSAWQWRAILRLLHPAGLLVFAAVALPWMWAMQQRFPDFFDYFIVEQHFRRFKGTTFNNARPVWFYLVVLATLLLPWTALLLARARGVWQQSAQVPGRARMLWALWAVVITGFFSMPHSKLVGYILPAVPPLMLFLAVWLAQVGGRWRTGVLAGSAAMCAALVVGATVQQHRSGSTSLAAADVVNQQDAQDPAWQQAPVIFYEEEFNDLRLMRQASTVRSPVVTDWVAFRQAPRDNWRKEFLDATRFAPAMGQALLWSPEQLRQQLCRLPRAWIMVPAEVRAQQAWLQALPQAASTKRGVLLRWQAGLEGQAAAQQECARGDQHQGAAQGQEGRPLGQPQ